MKVRATRAGVCRALGVLMACLPMAPLLGAPEGAAPASGISYQCRFARGQWQAGDWIPGKLPDWERGVKWAQEDGCIRNDTPAGAAPTELQGKRVADSRASMVYREPLQGDATVSATMDFSPRMAPLIVIAAALGESDEPAVKRYEGAFEIVLFDQGVNVWQHFWEDGKARHELAAYSRFPLKPDTPYRLVARKRGKDLQISVDGHTFGFRSQALPERYHVGITACEGINRFYDFAVEQSRGR